MLTNKQNKDASYETAVASEKRDSKEQNSPNENDSNGTPKFCDFADDDANASDDMEQLSSSPPTIVVVGSPRQSLFTSTPEKEKRRRSSTWHTKIERRRRKNSSNQSSISSSMVDDSDFDDLNGTSNGELGDSPPNEYSRQKRHSWWNIFVPDNIKQRYYIQRHAIMSQIMSRPGSIAESIKFHKNYQVFFYNILSIAILGILFY